MIRFSCTMLITVLFAFIGLASRAAGGDQGNRLTYLDGPADPYYVNRHTPKLSTPQWVGQDGVQAVVVLAIDDMTDVDKYERFLRPILDRLKKIDGRAPVSIMTKSVDPKSDHLQQWLTEGVSIEAHTADHPCPCLQKESLEAAKGTYDRCIDLLADIPGGRPVAFRMPCCDSMNSVSPRFFEEVFNRVTPMGNYLQLDTSVFHLFTANDPALPRDLVIDAEGRERFRKYLPSDRLMVNTIENYPYPYVVGRLCWEIPCLMPSDWDAQHFQGKCNPETVADMQRAIDATVVKQGMFALCFHPHGWIGNDQVIELIEYAVAKYGNKVLFLSLREVAERLQKNCLGGVALRAGDGSDNGVRLCDLNADGWMDVVVGNQQARRSRLWQPKTSTWSTTSFPVALVEPTESGGTGDAGVRFGVLQPNGQASVLVANSTVRNVWHFQQDHWAAAAHGIAGPGEVNRFATVRRSRDQGVRLRDIDHDGICELMIGNPGRRAVMAYSSDGWKPLSVNFPGETLIVDSEGRDAGLRFVDVDEDGYEDIVFSNAEWYQVSLYTPGEKSWTRTVLQGRAGDATSLPAIVRKDGTNNGAFFKNRHMWVQNEQTGGKLPDHVDRRYYTTDFLQAEKEPPPRSAESSLKSFVPRSGFRVELVASEPMVQDPVGMAWGPDGKLWVVEMADYPLGLDNQGKPGGRVRFLEDVDGDGRYDRSTLFLDKIPFPTGVMPWRKGVLITAAPTVFYAEDTDGDGRADLRTTLFDGFHEGNQQHRVNHMRWGLDNWIHVANGDSDGLIRSLKTGQVIDMSGLDLRFRPDDGSLGTDSGRSQFGRSRDDWGNWFGCNNSNPGWYYRLDDHYLSRNPHVAAPSPRADLNQFRDAYPAGRVMTHCFIDQPTPPEGQPARWTSACSVLIYRDDLFGPHYAGNAFTSDSVYNVIHRMVLSSDGLNIEGHRPADEELSEFLASADPWFRPTTLRVGPDGALWVADMYRHVIEHPQWIDDRLEKTLDLRNGHELGRIYRILPAGVEPRSIPRLDRLESEQLVARLDSPNGWQRDMVQQMLIWRQDQRAVPALVQAARRSDRPATRLQALCTLQGLGALTAELLITAVEDSHPAVRRHAIRLSEPLVGGHPRLHAAVLARVSDPDPTVIRQLAYSLGEWTDRRSGETLAALANRFAGDRVMMAAIMSSAVPHVSTMIADLSSDGQFAALVKQLEKLQRDISSYENAESRVNTTERARIVTRAKAITAGITRPERQAALDRFGAALELPGDPVRGRQIFVDATCSTCHRLDDVGQELGPDIRTLIDRSPQNLLVAILDPNRAVKERYVEYQAVTAQGRVYSGLLLEQTSNSIVLADNKGEKISILRRDLEELAPSERSFMSEGLESNMTLQSLADLMAFVAQAGSPRRRLPGNEPKTLLVQQNKSLPLPVAQAEIYGQDIVFDAESGSVSQWSNASPYLVWSVHLHRSQLFDAWIHAACPSSLKHHPFVLESLAQSLTQEMPSTSTWDDLQWVRVGTLELSAGIHRIALRAAGPIDGPLGRIDQVALMPPGQLPNQPRPETDTRPEPTTVRPDSAGVLLLSAASAKTVGPQIKYMKEFSAYGWFSAADRLVWSVQADQERGYDAWLEFAVDDANAGKPWTFNIGDQRLVGVAGRTGSWEDYRRIRIGRITLSKGVHQAVLQPGSSFSGYLMDFRSIQLVPAEKTP